MALDIAGAFTSLLGPNKEKVPSRPRDLSLTSELSKILGGAQSFLPQFQELAANQYTEGLDTYWQSNPLLKSLLGQTNEMVSGDLSLGSQMDPVEIRRATQSVGAGQSAAGFGQGSRRDRFEQAVQIATQGEALKQKRLANAMQLLGINQQSVPQFDPNYSANLLGGKLWGMSEDITGANFNRGIDERTAAQNRNAAEIAGYRKFVGDMVGSAAGAAGGAMCWVAREVYGEDNDAWKLFRFWLYIVAPTWFRKLYERHGARFARWLHNKPRVKAVIRRWMDSRIKSLEVEMEKTDLYAN